MNNELKEKMATSIADFTLPRYKEITNVGLYLEQTVKFINGYLLPLGEGDITASMISNYVKLKLIANPDHKQYNVDHIASLMFIAITKTVVSLDDIRFLLSIQKEHYTPQHAYDYFCEVFESVLFNSFGIKKENAKPIKNNSNKNELMLSTINAIVQKIYLDQYLLAYRNIEVNNQEIKLV